MKKATKICLIIAAALVLAGASVFLTVMSLAHWDFNMFSTVKYETNEHIIDKEFTDILIETYTSDIMFVPSADGEYRVVSFEATNTKHSVEVKDGVLEIKLQDARKWYDHISIFSYKNPTITVYIPAGEYGKLKIKSSTGDIDLHSQFKFESADISVSTADIGYYASTNGKISIKGTTGDITIGDITASEVDLKVSTGKISISNLTCPGDVKVVVSTGKSVITNVSCKSFISEGDTGDVILTGVLAADKFDIERSTGDVTFEDCDAGEIYIETSTGDVKGSFLTDKVVFANTDTGKIEVPQSTVGGRCEITTDTGDIEITIK